MARSRLSYFGVGGCGGLFGLEIFMEYRRDKDGRMQAYIGQKTHFENMLGRLRNEVAICLESYKTFNDTNKGSIGYWGLIRLLMPVVEAFGKAKYYPNIKDSWEYSSKVLKELGLAYPKIAWKLFRDCLIHDDELTAVIDDASERSSGWQVNIGGGHLQGGSPTIDLEKLYYDLYTAIETAISSATNEKELEIQGIRFSEKQRNKDAELANELKLLFP